MKFSINHVLAISVLALCGCASEPTSDAERATLDADTQATVTSFRNSDPSLKGLMDKSVGYAVFPEVGKAGLIIGGAHGKGEVWEHGRLIGYADLTKGSIGLQAGAQTFDELIIFLNQSELDKFKAGDFTFSADASAVAIKSGAGAAADHSKGVIVFVKPKGGLMAEASVGGQQFRFRPIGSDHYTDDRNYNKSNDHDDDDRNGDDRDDDDRDDDNR